ncbi:hypothetical protein SNE40_023078 [Patella caerulea]|uniref:Uncharacterized protein n=1 Tax=Patella caerulea TaxID=87958 RepID=A0AAN8GBP3_PATCE
MKDLIILVGLFGLFATGLALECYVCDNQPDNKDKCVKTTIQCREEQDTCQTTIKWKAPEFWTPRNEKMHHVFKSCSSSMNCTNAQWGLKNKCMRDWYKDWECVECCQGDRCNFYVTLGSANLKFSITLVALSLTLTAVFADRFGAWRLA